MVAYSRAADESVGYHETITLDPRVDDYNGWTFASTFAAFVGDPNAIALGMVSDESSDGWRLIDGPERSISIRISAATLAAYPDTSGRFSLFTNVLAAPPGGAAFHYCDITLTVQKGPTEWPTS